jgi:uncharacterized membrane protein
MIIALKIFFLIVGFFLLIWIYARLRQEKGDERMKQIAQLAGFGTWSMIMSWAGIKTLLLMVNVNLTPVFDKGENISAPVLLGTMITVYLALFAYHNWKKS